VLFTCLTGQVHSVFDDHAGTHLRMAYHSSVDCAQDRCQSGRLGPARPRVVLRTRSRDLPRHYLREGEDWTKLSMKTGLYSIIQQIYSASKDAVTIEQGLKARVSKWVYYCRQRCQSARMGGVLYS